MRSKNTENNHHKKVAIFSFKEYMQKMTMNKRLNAGAFPKQLNYETKANDFHPTEAALY